LHFVEGHVDEFLEEQENQSKSHDCNRSGSDDLFEVNEENASEKQAIQVYAEPSGNAPQDYAHGETQLEEHGDRSVAGNLRGTHCFRDA
jgi:hypothetical protein